MSEDLKLAGPSAPCARTRSAWLAEDIKTVKTHTEERKKNFKPSSYSLLCKNKQLLLIQVIFISMLDPPYSIFDGTFNR